jgi:hypothetical protein
MGFLSEGEKHEDCFSLNDGKKKKHGQARNQQSNYGLEEKLGSNWQVPKKIGETTPIVFLSYLLFAPWIPDVMFFSNLAALCT